MPGPGSPRESRSVGPRFSMGRPAASRRDRSTPGHPDRARRPDDRGHPRRRRPRAARCPASAEAHQLPPERPRPPRPQVRQAQHVTAQDGVVGVEEQPRIVRQRQIGASLPAGELGEWVRSHAAIGAGCGRYRDSSTAAPDGSAPPAPGSERRVDCRPARTCGSTPGTGCSARPVPRHTREREQPRTRHGVQSS
jgi:hypothetical protein